MSRALVLLLFCLALLGCGGASGRPGAGARPVPRFEDALEGVPDAMLAFRPQALGADPVFGPLWRRAMRVALARGGAGATGDRMLVAIESAESVVFVLERMREGEAALALRGVRADLDPTRLLDEARKPMWREAATNGVVTEYVSADAADRVALFVLPGREWVFIFGDGAPRARQGFAAPRGAARLDDEDAALALFRMRGGAFVKEIRSLRAPDSPLAPVGQRLTDLTVALAMKGRGVVVGLRYLDEASAAAAAKRLAEIIEVLKTSKDGERFTWLRAAELERDATVVRLRTPLPLRLLEDLPKAGGAPIEI